MTAITKTGAPSRSTTENGFQVGSGLICGEDIAAGDACQIRSDGLVWRSIADSAAHARVDGYAAQAARVAQKDAVTLWDGAAFGYGTSLAKGSSVYLSATAAGGIDTAASTYAQLPCGIVLNDGKRVRLYRSAGRADASLVSSSVEQVAKVALTALDTGGGVLAWQNPEGAAILVNRLLVDLTTVATGAVTVDFGTTAVSAATSSENLIDSVDLHTAVGLFDNITDKGSNGKSRQKLASGKWLTGSMASGAAAGLAGYAYIYYTLA